jgi:hypothetical protein
MICWISLLNRLPPRETKETMNNALGIWFSLWSLNSLNLTIGILINNNWFLIVLLG